MENDSVVKIEAVADEVEDNREEQSDGDGLLFLLSLEDTEFFPKITLFNAFPNIFFESGLNTLDAPWGRCLGFKS